MSGTPQKGMATQPMQAVLPAVAAPCAPQTCDKTMPGSPASWGVAAALGAASSSVRQLCLPRTRLWIVSLQDCEAPTYFWQARHNNQAKSPAQPTAKPGGVSRGQRRGACTQQGCMCEGRQQTRNQ